MKIRFAAIILLAFGSSLGVVSQPSAEPTAIAESLPPKLREFLKKEMHLLADAGRVMEAALAKGDSKTVGKLAQQMHESFILKKELTTLDLRELQAIVGDDFVVRDKAFHAMARELSLAAQTDDVSLQQVLFTKMTYACAACHAVYAPKASVLE